MARNPELPALGSGAVILSVPSGLKLIGAAANRALQALLRQRLKSPYSHAAIMLDGGHVMDSQPGRGVTNKSFRLWKSTIDLNRSIVLVPDLDRLGIDADRLNKAIEFEMGCPYGYGFTGLLAKRDLPNAVFCTQFIAKVYNGFLAPDLRIPDRVLPIDLEEILENRGFRRYKLAELTRVDPASGSDSDEYLVGDLPAMALDTDFRVSFVTADAAKTAFAAVAVASANSVISAAVHGGGGQSIGTNVMLLKQYGELAVGATTGISTREFRRVSELKVELATCDRSIKYALSSTRIEAERINKAVHDLLVVAATITAGADEVISLELGNRLLASWSTVVFDNWMTFAVADLWVNEKKQFEGWCEGLNKIATWVRNDNISSDARKLWVLTEACAIALYLIANAAQPWIKMGLCLQNPDPKRCGIEAFESHSTDVKRVLGSLLRGETDDLEWINDVIISTLGEPSDTQVGPL